MPPTTPDRARLAPLPLSDKSPTVLGQGITLTYLASVKRIATYGYRQQFVDLLSELLEEDPHAYCVMQQRILAVAGGRLEIQSAELAQDDPEREEAEAIAAEVRGQINRLPNRTQSIAALMWGVFFGLSCAENIWAREPARWRIERLGFVHSRRLAYPESGSWELHIWDQGQVLGGRAGFYQPTNGPSFGLRVSDYPGKFVVHAPQVRGEYPTRDGLGRQIATYLCLKRMIVRVSAQDFERFVKPWVIAYYTTTDAKTGKPRLAGTEDIAAADEAMRAAGIGALAGVTLPDSVRIELLRAASTLNLQQFLDYLDAASSKAIAGQTFTVQSGQYGTKGTADMGKVQQLELARYDAAVLSDTLERDLVSWIVRFNFPGRQHLCPRVRILVEETPDRKAVIDVAAKAVAIGMPVDADKLGEGLGLVLTPNTTGKPRRLSPVSAVALSSLDPTIAPPPAPPANDVETDEETGSEDEADDEPEADTDTGEPAPPDDEAADEDGEGAAADAAE